MRKLSTLFFIILFSSSVYSQGVPGGFGDDELNVGGDIFQDFNEDLEATQVMEDERFYRYSRFYSVLLGLGLTTFTNNRGLAYEDNHPSFNFGLLYFLDFQNAFIMGISFSSHTAIIDDFVQGSQDEIIGRIKTSMLRPYMGFRYYIDTSDLGTAITYSSPYFTGRVEYWYQTNEFPDASALDTVAEGGMGASIGAGLEFPIELKKSYFNVEFLYHRVDFFDKDTVDYRPMPAGIQDCGEDGDDDGDRDEICTGEGGFDDLRGDVITIMMNYVISW